MKIFSLVIIEIIRLPTIRRQIMLNLSGQPLQNKAKNNNNLSISKNLNNSMIKFIKENKDKSHPAFWAPFVIVGNDQKLNI